MANETIARWQRALADFGYPHRLVPYERVHETFRAERELGLREAFTPIILVPGYWNSATVSAGRRAKRASALIAEHGAAFDAAFGRSFLAGETETMREDWEQDPTCPDPALFDALQPIGPPAADDGIRLLWQYNADTRSMGPVFEAAIMRIPTTEGATIPVYLDWGGWNAVPQPLEICAVSRHWSETYGAELIAIGSDQLEYSVARKPASHADAVALLKEQYCFAPDNWEFDRTILEQAAAGLRTFDTWSFWWD